MVSKAVSTGIRLKLWKMKPMLAARKSDSASSDKLLTNWPATLTSPWSGLSMQASMLSNVVLPLPEGPSKTVNWAGRTRRLTSRMMGRRTWSSQ